MTALAITAVAVVALALTGVAAGIRAEIRKAARAADQQREKALLKPHAAWLHQHDIDRQFNAIVAAEWTEPSR